MAAFAHPEPPIVIDGVFFQFGRSGIARVWMSLLEKWAGTPFGNRLAVIDRARHMPRVPGIRYVDAAAHNYHDLPGDRRLVQRVCDELGAAVFVSTYYSLPLTTPSVALVHDMIPEVLGHDLTTPMWHQKRQALDYAESYVAISHNTARDLRRVLDREVDVRVHYNGNDLAPVTADEVADFRRRHRIARPYFMTSGSRADYKNATLFFDAFARFGDARRDYAIVCTGGGELDPACRAAAGDASVHVAIFDDHDLRCAYAGALALVYPSRYEGFGLPVLEAMACECPVITTTASSLPEVGGDAVLYVELGEGDVARVHELLLHVQRPEVRADLVARGRAQAARFDWRDMVDGLSAALSEAAARHPAPAPMSAEDAALMDFQPHVVGPHTLHLPARHALPGLQREHRLFGRLPSALGAVLDDGDGVLLAGAGCGVSLAALQSARPGLDLVAVEADAGNFSWLRRNTQAMGQGAVPAAIRLVHAPIADGEAGAISAVAASHFVAPVRLVVSSLADGGASGLSTAADLCAAEQPMLLFPCQPGADDASTSAWRQRFGALWSAGYTGFWLLDNYGNPIVEAATPQSLHQALAYVARQNRGAVARSVWYYDVLAFTERDAARARRAIELHLG